MFYCIVSKLYYFLNYYFGTNCCYNDTLMFLIVKNLFLLFQNKGFSPAVISAWYLSPGSGNYLQTWTGRKCIPKQWKTTLNRWKTTLDQCKMSEAQVFYVTVQLLMLTGRGILPAYWPGRGRGILPACWPGTVVVSCLRADPRVLSSSEPTSVLSRLLCCIWTDLPVTCNLLSINIYRHMILSFI